MTIKFPAYLCCILPLFVSAQPVLEWRQELGNGNYCRAYSIAVVPDGGYMIAGKTYNSENQSDDLYIIKTDLKGNIVWEKMFGASGDESASAIIATPDGGFLLAGQTQSKGNGGQDIWILKINRDGALLWERTYGGKLDEQTASLKPFGNNGYIICGHQMTKASSTIKAYLLHIDPEGRLLWEKSFGDQFRNYARDALFTHDALYVTGYFHPMSNATYKSDMGWVARFDTTGKLLWQHIYGGNKEDHLNNIACTSEGALYVSGHTASFGKGYFDYWIMRLNTLGDTLWQRTYGFLNRDEGMGLIADQDGCTISGYISSRESNTTEMALVRFDENGEKAWDKICSDKLNSRPACMRPTPDGGLILAGEACTKYQYDSKPVHCKCVAVKMMGSPAAGVQYYVSLKVSAWEKRGEFEKSETYHTRVSEENRKKVIAKHTAEAIAYYASQSIDVDQTTLSTYDADSEMYVLNIPETGPARIAVPIEEAQPFKASWQSKNYTFEHAVFDLQENRFILKGLDLIINGKVYAYNTKEAPGRFIFTEERESPAESSLYRGGGDPLKGLNLSKAKNIASGRYFALIIGIDNYKGQWPALNNAVHDAQSIELMLKKKYAFDQFKTLYDEQATREQIINAFYWLVENVRENDNVFIYYSGHGEFNKKLNKGYWVPVDAQTASISVYISNADIQTFLNGIPSRHTLLISDACFSGDIFRGNTLSVPFEESEKYYREVGALTSRQAITSGGIEPVMDGGKDGHSVFAYYLLKTLNANEKPLMDAATLFNKIKIPVVNNSDQTPKFQPIKNTGDEGGQFIFIKK